MHIGYWFLILSLIAYLPVLRLRGLTHITEPSLFWLKLCGRSVALFVLCFGLLYLELDSWLTSSISLSLTFFVPAFLGFSFSCFLILYNKEKKVSLLSYLFPLYYSFLSFYPGFVEVYFINSKFEGYTISNFNLWLYSIPIVGLFFVLIPQLLFIQKKEENQIIRRQKTLLTGFIAIFIVTFFIDIVFELFLESKAFDYIIPFFLIGFSWFVISTTTQYRLWDYRAFNEKKKKNIISLFLASVFCFLFFVLTVPEASYDFYTWIVLSAVLSVSLFQLFQDVLSGKGISRKLGFKYLCPIEGAHSLIKEKNHSFKTVEEVEAFCGEILKKAIGSTFVSIVFMEESLYQSSKDISLSYESVFIKSEKYFSEEKYSIFWDFFDPDTEVVFPLSNEDEMMGFVAIGKKQSEDLYSEEEIRSLLLIVQDIGLHFLRIQYHKELKKAVKNHTAKLIVANQKLKLKDKEKDLFLSIVSHEIRIPLCVIKGYGEVISSQAFGALSKEYKEFGSQIQVRSEEVLLFVSNMLEVGRLGEQNRRLNLSVFNIREEMDQIKDHFTFLREPLSVRFEVLVGSTVPEFIQSDLGKWRAILQNLLSNAFKFTSEGSIIAKLHDEKNYYLLEVEDSGAGMTKIEQAYIFDRYEQTIASIEKQQQGFGVGLYIVKKFTEELKGTVSVHSNYGNGTTFYVRIPKVIEGGDGKKY